MGGGGRAVVELRVEGVGLEGTYIKERMTTQCRYSPTYYTRLQTTTATAGCPTMRGLCSQSEMGEREGRGRVSLSRQFWQVPVRVHLRMDQEVHKLWVHYRSLASLGR